MRLSEIEGMDLADGLILQDCVSALPKCRVGSEAFVSHSAHVGERVCIGHDAVVNGRESIGAVAIGNLAAGARVCRKPTIPRHRSSRMPANADTGGPA
jgi:carbonic anhydrase/acetyltransferase-like protein (isoleucine patch superfamily)